MDKRIDERLRKPRRTKGTPFYIQRNYWAAGVIIAGGLSWFLLELTPGFKYLKKYSKEHLLEDSEETVIRSKHQIIARTRPAVDHLLIKAKEKAAYKDEPEPQGWFAKLFSNPDL